MLASARALRLHLFHQLCQSMHVHADEGHRGSRGVPAWMATGDDSEDTLSDAPATVRNVGDKGGSDFSRMRQEIEAERLHFKRQAAEAAAAQRAASSAQVQAL